MADISKTIGNVANAKAALSVGKKIFSGGKMLIASITGLSGITILATIIFLSTGLLAIFALGKTAQGGFGNNPLANVGSGGGALTYPAGADPNEIGTCIDNWLKKNVPKSPLIGHGLAFAKAGQTSNVNPGFMLAIAGSESTFAIAYDNSKYSSTRKFNFFNMKARANFAPDASGYAIFKSFEESIPEYAGLLRRNYLDKGFDKLNMTFSDRYCGPVSQIPICKNWLPDTTAYFNKITAACPSLAVASPTPGAKGNKICIDAGHNSNESRGFIGGSEGANNLEIAKKLESSLKKLGFETFMTRTGATYNGSEAKRKQDVNNAGCAISISIHSNSDGPGGTQTYSCNQKYPVRWDSFPDPIDSPNKKPIQYKIGNDGSKLANIIHPLVVQAFNNKNAGIHLDTEAAVMKYRTGSNAPDKQVTKDGYGWASSLGMVCRTNMPSILIEVGFHDIPAEAALLKNPQKQQQVADAIAQGVKTYLGK